MSSSLNYTWFHGSADSGHQAQVNTGEKVGWNAYKCFIIILFVLYCFILLYFFDQEMEFHRLLGWGARRKNVCADKKKPITPKGYLYVYVLYTICNDLMTDESQERVLLEATYVSHCAICQSSCYMQVTWVGIRNCLDHSYRLMYSLLTISLSAWVKVWVTHKISNL